jgi:hypothetical protein
MLFRFSVLGFGNLDFGFGFWFGLRNLPGIYTSQGLVYAFDLISYEGFEFSN